MCDYSLEHYRSRPAQEGEEYQTHRFPTGSVGLIAPDDPTTAVCLACDMRLKLDGIPEHLPNKYSVSSTEYVTFIRLDTPLQYRDGVRFSDGTELTLQELGPGVTVYVTDALLGPHKGFVSVGVAKKVELETV